MKYGLVWEDKVEELDKKDIIPLLRCVPELSLLVLDDKPKNYLIEGDNYHALKALQFTHKGAIDVIYIDPPYNTGNNDFVYNDRIVDSEDGFRHSKWLSFMDKRLRLARELMSDDGVIFVSIDDNEQAQLKLLMDSIFGERNVETLVWNTEAEGKSGSLKQVKRFRGIHEYVIVGYINKSTINLNKVKEAMVDPVFQTANLTKTQSQKRGDVERLFEIRAPSGRVWVDEWKFSKDVVDEFIKNNRLYFGKDGTNKPRLVIETGDNREIYQTSIVNIGSTSQGTKDLLNILSDVDFSYPKPVNLLKRLINLHGNESATVLDFFAGSGTTGHAVMELNKEDGGQRSFILCTNNEVSKEIERGYMHEHGIIEANNKKEYSKFKKDHAENPGAFDFRKKPEYQALGIARAVTRERIKRVIEGYTTPKGKDITGMPNNLTYLQTHEFPRVLQRIGGAAEWQRGRKFTIEAASTRTARLAKSR